tara:strand:+ start:57 stop:239 length:183 start_codon:yes stop_codon:yes gene_type:complete
VAVISMPQVETLLLPQGLIFITPLPQVARSLLYLVLLLLAILLLLVAEVGVQVVVEQVDS